MTDKILTTKEIVQSRLKARYGAEQRFKAFGIGMVALAIIACAMLLFSIFAQALPALSESRLSLNVYLDPAKIDPAGRRDPQEIRAQGDFSGVIVDSLVKRFPAAETDGSIDDLMDVVATISANPLAVQASKHPELIGKNLNVNLALNDDMDMFLKGGFGKLHRKSLDGAQIAQTPDGGIDINAANNGFSALKSEYVEMISGEFNKKQIELNGMKSKEKQLLSIKGRTPEQEIELATVQGDMQGLEDYVKNFQATTGNKAMDTPLTDSMPSIIILSGGGAYKATLLGNGKITGSLLVTPNAPLKDAKIVMLDSASDTRPLNDKGAALALIMQADGMVKSQFNWTLLTRSDSNDPEMAGVLSAVVGSLLTLLVTFGVAVPVGVMAAIYLEEFAHKNWLTDLIEVNINNLAAVPSIVFGLLGFSVFLHFFGMPRSAPIVGGVVLSLMCLPVVIIAARAALKAVPPSIREAALGVGASKVQAVFHHVLPLALPGIMTGSILAMAHALGETAPLLMIGMVAFIADVPKSFTDAATVLPVTIFMWAGRPERAWEAKTSAAIIVLLIFMLIMNAVAIMLRRKFERRW